MSVKLQQLSTWSTGPGTSTCRSINFRNRFADTCSSESEVATIGWGLKNWATYGLTGDKDAGLLFGGVECGFDATEEYDGTTWASANSMPFGPSFVVGTGTQNATLATGFSGVVRTTVSSNSQGAAGYSTAARYACDHCTMTNFHCSPNQTSTQFLGHGSLEYNGTSWDTTITDIVSSDGTTRCMNIAGGAVGTMTNALIFGGVNFDPAGLACTPIPQINLTSGDLCANFESVVTTSDRVYNGTSWSTTGNTLNVNRIDGQYFGNAESAVMAGGALSHNPSAGTYDDAFADQARSVHESSTAAEEYDGTTWSVVNSLPIARCGGGGAGTQNDGVIFGGMNVQGSISSNSAYNSNTNAIISYFGLYSQHYDGITWKNASSLMNNHRFGIRGAGSSVGAGLAGIGAGRTPGDTPGPMGPLCGDSTRGINEPTTNAWYSERCEYDMGGCAQAISSFNGVEEYNVTTGGVQFGPRIASHKLSSLWDVGNYKSIFSREYDGDSSDGFPGRLGGNDKLANPSLTEHWNFYTGESYGFAGDVSGCNSECSLPAACFAGGGLANTGYKFGDIQFKGWSVGPDLHHYQRIGKGSVHSGNGPMSAGSQNDIIHMGGASGTESSGTFNSLTSIYQGLNWSEGPQMLRAVSHGASTGNSSRDAFVVGNKYVSNRTVVQNMKNCSPDSLKYNIGISSNDAPAPDSNFFPSSEKSACRPDLLSDYQGDFGGHNPLQVCSHYATQELDGLTWSDGGALPIGVFTGIGPFTESDTQEGSVFNHNFIGSRQAVGDKNNALFVHENNAPANTYYSAPYLRGDKAVTYDGTSWTATSNPLHSGKFAGQAMAGSPDSTLRVIGSDVGGCSGGNEVSCKKHEEFDGFVWSQLPNQLLPRNFAGFTSNNACSAIIWGGSGEVVLESYARSDEWDGNTWAASCAMVMHIPAETAWSYSFADSPNGGIYRAGLGLHTGTVYDENLGSVMGNCLGMASLQQSHFAYGAGSTKSSNAALGFVLPQWKVDSERYGQEAAPTAGVGSGVDRDALSTSGNLSVGHHQTTFWNNVSLKDIKNNLHFNVTGSSFKPNEALLDCTNALTQAITGSNDQGVQFGTTCGQVDFNDGRINTAFKDKNHYIALNGSGSLESDFYLAADTSYHTSGDEGFENCLYDKTWSVEKGLTQDRIMMDAAGTPDGALVAGGQSCSPGNASVSTFNNVELWDGTQYTTGPTLPSSTRRHVTLGSCNHAHVFAGYCPGSNPASANLQNSIQQYLNGSWSNLSATISQVRADAMGAGKAGGWILWGGSTVGCTNNLYAGSLTDCVEVYNGDTVSAGTNTPTIIAHQGAAGSSNSAIGVGGICENPSPSTNVNQDTTSNLAGSLGQAGDQSIKWDGTSWSAGPNQLIKTHFQAGAGTQNSSVFWGGATGAPNSPNSVIGTGTLGMSEVTQEFDGVSFKQAARLPQNSNFVNEVNSVCRGVSSDGAGNSSNHALAIGRTYPSSATNFIYGNYRGHKSDRIAADKASGGLTISMWVRMPRTADSYSDTDPAWDNKLYLAANADVDVTSYHMSATQDVPRSGVRLLRYYNGSGDRIRLEWQNDTRGSLGSSSYNWDANGNQSIISYFQTSENQTFVTTDWYNIVAVASFDRDSSTNKIFINGVKQTLELSSQQSSIYHRVEYPINRTAKFRIGRFAGKKYELDVANVMYHTRQLSDDEVIQNYKTLLPRFL